DDIVKTEDGFSGMDRQREMEEMAGVVSGLSVTYIDTCPVAVSMSLLREGYLFVAAEQGDHRLYRFTGLGDPVVPELVGDSVPVFTPQSQGLLEAEAQIPSLSPLISMRPLRIHGRGVLAALSGTGSNSKLSLLEYGTSATIHGTLKFDRRLEGSELKVFSVGRQLENKQARPEPEEDAEELAPIESEPEAEAEAEAEADAEGKAEGEEEGEVMEVDGEAEGETEVMEVEGDDVVDIEEEGDVEAEEEEVVEEESSEEESEDDGFVQQHLLFVSLSPSANSRYST
ncbi:hypothetical protein KIPB_013725, partial [Kipferlia bialata]